MTIEFRIEYLHNIEWLNSTPHHRLFYAPWAIKDTMLDLGSHVNLLPRNTWEALGSPKIVFSLIQLQMANQHCILPIG